jgi:hypothetical protein
LEQASDNRTERPVLELAGLSGSVSSAEPVALPELATAADNNDQPPIDEQVSDDLDTAEPARNGDTAIQIIRATRSWIQYGMVGFTVFCIVIGALESILIRLGL